MYNNRNLKVAVIFLCEGSMFADVGRKILLLSVLSSCVLGGMENVYFAVRIIPSFRFFSVNGIACTKYPLLIIDKIRDTPAGYCFFDHRIKAIFSDATSQTVALVCLTDNSTRRIDLLTGKELGRI